MSTVSGERMDTGGDSLKWTHIHPYVFFALGNSFNFLWFMVIERTLEKINEFGADWACKMAGV